ncbi:MAG: carboxypeptidase regulatory-like domain-containing protein [Acidimicrobiales bacterium]|nr:carboxypeptidase regulatory-like domain-containing protein [Acidimicrobiales bacterium]
MFIRTSLRRLAVAATATLGLLALTPAPGEAAGVTTHGWMAVSAIPKVSDPALRQLLAAHEDQVRAGGMFPDSGYIPGNTYGEEAHWQRFVDAYTDQILDRDDCGDITAPDGPCADMISHLMGVAAHGMGDEVWDWLFEPNGPDLDEYYTNPANTAFNEGGAESQMDVVAIGVHGVPRPNIPPLPSESTLIAAFDEAGLHTVTPNQFALQGLGELVWDAENSWVATYLADIEAAMPWMSANMVTAPGGVDFASTAIAGYWEYLWGRLTGDVPATRVSITYPAPGQTDIPATGWDRASFQPGSSRGRGGARTRVTAVLTSAMPYQHVGGPAVTNEQPAGSMTIRDRQTGALVPLRSGYPRAVPYGADSGEHVIDVQPDTNLQPCRWYDVSLSVDAPLFDSRGLPVTPHEWAFRTECTGNALTGTVTGPGGSPVKGAWVLAYRPTDGFAPTAIGVTGADGHYAVSVPADPSYLVGVLTPPALGLSNAIAPGRVSVAGAPVEVNLTVEAAPSLTGQVLEPDGSPVSGASVALFGPTDTWIPSVRTTTDADGNFALQRLGPKSYTVAYKRSSDSRWTFFDRTYDRNAATKADLAAGPATLTLRLLPTSS